MRFYENSRPAPAPTRTPSSLVAIRSGGERSLFLIHPGEGTVLCYVGLTPEIISSYSVFGVAFPEQYRGRKYSMQQLAAQYRTYIQEKQPYGPYVIGGYSFGGAVAAEIALQLEAFGQKVECLIMVDSYPPQAYASAKDCDAQSCRAVAPWLLRTLVADTEFDAERLAAASAIEDIVDSVVKPIQAVRERQRLVRLLQVWAQNYNVLKDWVPGGRLSCMTLIFAASDPMPEKILRPLRINPGPMGQWRDHLGAKVKIISVSGDHYSIFRDKKNLKIMGRIIGEKQG